MAHESLDAFLERVRVDPPPGQAPAPVSGTVEDVLAALLGAAMAGPTATPVAAAGTLPRSVSNSSDVDQGGFRARSVSGARKVAPPPPTVTPPPPPVLTATPPPTANGHAGGPGVGPKPPRPGPPPVAAKPALLAGAAAHRTSSCRRVHRWGRVGGGALTLSPLSRPARARPRPAADPLDSEKTLIVPNASYAMVRSTSGSGNTLPRRPAVNPTPVPNDGLSLAERRLSMSITGGRGGVPAPRGAVAPPPPLNAGGPVPQVHALANLTVISHSPPAPPQGH